MAAWTEHIAGALTDGVQHCVKCGVVLIDYRNAATIEGSGPLRGWPEGPLYVRGNFSTTTGPINETINLCSSSRA